MTMITLHGKEPKDMNRTEIREELKVQRFMMHIIKKYLSLSIYKRDRDAIDLDAKRKELKDLQWLFDSWQIDRSEFMSKRGTAYSQIAQAVLREDKVTFLEIYKTNLEALIDELEFYKDRRAEAKKDRETSAQRYERRLRYKKTQEKLSADTTDVQNWKKSVNRAGINLSWDKEKFMLIANDRGYQTEAAVVLAIQKELGYSKARARVALNSGKFTWGQVMCLGALMQMTPKEFCDTFLNGYFVDYYGNYIASYKNVSKEALLKASVKPDAPEMAEDPFAEFDNKEIATDSSGKPIEDDEVWFDD